MKVAFVRLFQVPSLIPGLIPILLCGTAIEAAAQKPAREPAQQQPAQPLAQLQDTTPRYRFRVLGVYDERTGDPIADAKISDMASGMSSLTTSTGTVSLIFLPDGGSLVHIGKVGYEPQTMPVAISPDDTTPLTLVMQPLVISDITRLPTVKTTAAAPYISPGLRGFQEREKTGAAGYFIDDTTLRKNEGHQLSAVLGPRAPGTFFTYGPHSATYVHSMHCAGGTPTIYLDDVLLVGDPGPPRISGETIRSTRTPPNLSQFQVSDLGAVEWYPSTDMAPIQYGGTTGGCGVLLLWTRER